MSDWGLPRNLRSARRRVAGRGTENRQPSLTLRVNRLRPLRSFRTDRFRGHLLGRVQIRWAPDEEVTPLGQMPFFIDFLKQAGLFDAFVQDASRSYSSSNRPCVRDVLGTLLLTTLSGARRRMHINLPRYEPVNPRLLRHAQSVR